MSGSATKEYPSFSSDSKTPLTESTIELTGSLAHTHSSGSQFQSKVHPLPFSFHSSPPYIQTSWPLEQPSYYIGTLSSLLLRFRPRNNPLYRCFPDSKDLCILLCLYSFFLQSNWVASPMSNSTARLILVMMAPHWSTPFYAWPEHMSKGTCTDCGGSLIL